MKKSNSNIWLKLVVAAVLVIAAIFLVKQCTRPKGPDVIATIDSVSYYKNKLGDSVAVIKQREQDFYRIKEAGFLDSIAKLYNTKEKLIQEVVTLRMRGATSIATDQPPKIVYEKEIVPGECPPGISFIEQYFSDTSYYNALVHIPVKDAGQSVILIETFDTLTSVVTFKKEGGLFNRKEYLEVSASNKNPYNRIEGMEVFRRPLPKPKKWAIGFQAGYGLGNSFRPSPYIGIGVTRTIIRF